MSGPLETAAPGRAARCAEGSPLSYLALELYHLGELPPARSREVETHLDRCPACRSCLDGIRAEGAPALRPLPSPLPRRGGEAPRGKLLPFARRHRAGVAVVLVAAAAAVLLVVALPGGPGRVPGEEPPREVAFKGGDLAISLVRARGDETENDPTRFEQGDRFKVLATSPRVDPPLGFDVVVYQDRAASFPLRRGGALPAGNREPLPGAFSLDGRARALVCLVAGSPGRLPSRGELARGLPAATGGDLGVVCARLEP